MPRRILSSIAQPDALAVELLEDHGVTATPELVALANRVVDAVLAGEDVSTQALAPCDPGDPLRIVAACPDLQHRATVSPAECETVAEMACLMLTDLACSMAEQVRSLAPCYEVERLRGLLVADLLDEPGNVDGREPLWMRYFSALEARDALDMAA